MRFLILSFFIITGCMNSLQSDSYIDETRAFVKDYCPHLKNRIEDAHNYLKKTNSCQLAIIQFPGILKDPEICENNKSYIPASVVCIADITHGKGINQKSGCAEVQFDLITTNFERGRTRDGFIENKLCSDGGFEELTSKKLLANVSIAPYYLDEHWFDLLPLDSQFEIYSLPVFSANVKYSNWYKKKFDDYSKKRSARKLRLKELRKSNDELSKFKESILRKDICYISKKKEDLGLGKSAYVLIIQGYKSHRYLDKEDIIQTHVEEKNPAQNMENTINIDGKLFKAYEHSAIKIEPELAKLHVEEFEYAEMKCTKPKDY